MVLILYAVYSTRFEGFLSTRHDKIRAHSSELLRQKELIPDLYQNWFLRIRLRTTRDVQRQCRCILWKFKSKKYIIFFLWQMALS